MPTIVLNILYVHNYEQQQNVWPEHSKWYDYLREVSRIQRYEPSRYIITLYVHFLSFVKIFLSFSERVRE